MKTIVQIPEFKGGITANLSMRLERVLDFYRDFNRLPDEIDGSKQFLRYKKNNKHDIAKTIFNSYTSSEIKPVDFNQRFQFQWYDEIPVGELSQAAHVVCPLSDVVLSRYQLYNKLVSNRTAVLYRGNNKVKEIPRTPYQSMVEMAEDSGSRSFIIQTDELEFYSYFTARFPDTIRISDLPMIPRDDKGCIRHKSTEFCVNFLAAVMAMGKADRLITNSGNVGMWAVLFRRNTNNVWQFNGKQGTWKRLQLY